MLVLQRSGVPEQKPVNMSNYSPQMIEKMTSKWLSLATTSILGQAPSPHISPDRQNLA